MNLICNLLQGTMHGTIRCKRDVVAVLLFGFGQQAVILLPVSARQKEYDYE